jgi:hypothetical protein
MVSLKKASFLLVLLTAVVLSSGIAGAQVVTAPSLITCNAFAVPPAVRAEGISEQVGDIVLTCTGGDPNGPPTIQTNFSVALNVNITPDEDSSPNPDVLDSVLIVNENNATDYDPTPGGGQLDCSGTNFEGPTGTRNQCPQLATQAANNRAEWNGVVVPVPATEDGINDDGDGITTIRITSLRGNAAQLGVPDAATFPSTQITAFLSITGPTTIPITPTNVLNVAVPVVGLIVGFDGDSDGINGLQCVDGEESGTITLTEGFPTAFKTLGVSTFGNFTDQRNTVWEAGYWSPLNGSSILGGATQGTRFIFRMFNMPDGTIIEVPDYVNDGNPPCADTTLAFNNGCGDGLELALVPSAGTNGAGGKASGSKDPSDLTEISVSGGFGYVVYEVIDANPYLSEDIDVPFTVTWESDTENEIPSVGSAQISVDFAPLSTNFNASESEPEPRFIETDEARTFLNIVKCTSTILFPFVTNQAGFDTGIAISNTSLDWLGTTPQNGACTIHYHGSTTGGGALAEDEQTSSIIAGGEQLIFTLSGGNPGQGIAGAPEFQGYVIAVCDFQYGHGYAFITDGFGGIPALAQGYLALILELGGDSNSAGSRALSGGIESLGH